MARQELCFQCGKQGIHPVVAVINVDLLAENPERVVTVVELRDDGKFATVPVCEHCWRNPTLDAHFAFRTDAEIALERAGSANLGG